MQAREVSTMPGATLRRLVSKSSCPRIKMMSTNLYTVLQVIEERKTSTLQREGDRFFGLLYTIFQNAFAWKYQVDAARQVITAIHAAP
jgi:hypothetical protein